jgi:thiamine pyrophosphate-dependent acetolactate synthase large subunit-like protein
MKVHAALARGLKDHGIEVVFGLIGDANLFMVERYVDGEEGTYVAAANEAGAVLMAYGHARRTGTLGVATVTHGPGVTNTVTALVEGARSRTPILMVCGDTAATDHWNLQNIAQREVIVASGAGFEQVGSPETVLRDLSRAIRRALTERRPVALNVPIEYMWEDVEYAHVPTNILSTQVSVEPDPAALDEALGVVSSSHRPLVLVGAGVSEKAKAAVLRLAERLGAPVATTLGAKGKLAGERYSLGIFGTLSTPVGYDIIQSADCVVAFGASLNRWTTSIGSLLQGKAVVQCDADVTAVGRHSPVTAGVVGDAGAVADAMCRLLDEGGMEPSSFRTPEMAESIKSGSVTAFEDRSTASTIDVRKALIHLNEALPANRTLVTDGGRFVHYAWTLLDALGPQAFIYSVAFGSIGLGLATAIGASYGAGDDPVVVVTGDGGFMLGGISEFNTAVRHGRNVIVIVCNDMAYGAEHIQFRDRDLSPKLSMFDWPDLAEVASALGGTGVTVRTDGDLERAAEAIRSVRSPLLIDLRLDPDHIGQSVR